MTSLECFSYTDGTLKFSKIFHTEERTDTHSSTFGNNLMKILQQRTVLCSVFLHNGIFFVLIRVKYSLNFDVHSPYIAKKDSDMVIQMAACSGIAVLFMWKLDIPESPCSHN